MNPTAPSFDRLEMAVATIALHPDYRGKRETVAECIDDIEDRWNRGMLDLEQRFRLLAILMRGKPPEPAGLLAS